LPRAPAAATLGAAIGAPPPCGTIGALAPRTLAVTQRHSLLRSLSLVLACAAALVAGLGAWRTVSVTGDAALATLDAAERELLARVGRIDRGMQRAEVERALGPASDWTGLGASAIGHWRAIPGAPLAELRVYFDTQGAARVRWMKLGYFTYEASLPPRARAP
jgi:hypothetical protein